MINLKIFCIKCVYKRSSLSKSQELCAYGDEEEAADDARVTSPNDVTFDQSPVMTSSLLLIRPDDVSVTSSRADADEWTDGVQIDASSTSVS